MEDGFELARFVTAQEPVWARVKAELTAGAKASHWMWFVFPQLTGLGASAMAQRYAISGRAEAVAYLAHELLGARLREATGLMLGHEGRAAAAILGGIDAVKFCSCLTLFGAVSDEAIFERALAVFYGGAGDARTLALLKAR